MEDPTLPDPFGDTLPDSGAPSGEVDPVDATEPGAGWRSGSDSDVRKVDPMDPTLVLDADSTGQAPAGSGDEAFANSFRRYRTFIAIGSGGVGTVKRCEDPHLGREVALKALHAQLKTDPRQRTRFVREARVMAQIEHPNVVPVHELGVDEEGNVYFTMKRIKGVTLEHILRELRKGNPKYTERYTISHLVDVFVDVCHAVAFAHSRGVLHRDLKPANILVGAFGEVLVLDWGLAKIIGDPDDPEEANVDFPSDEELNLTSGSVTLEGSVCGTPMYMSPEQAMGRVSEIDERSDVYSLGGLLYELLTLERAHSGVMVTDILFSVAYDPVVPPRTCAPERRIARELSAICVMAMAKEKEARYPSVEAMLQDIRDYQSGLSIVAAPDSLPRRAWKACKRHPVLSTTSAAVLAVLVIGTTSLGTAFALRYLRLMDEAEHNRDAGSLRFDKKVELYAEWKALRDANTTKTPTVHEESLREKIEELHRENEIDYSSAVIQYMMATDDRENRRRLTGLREIFGNRLHYGVLTGNADEAKKWLNFLRDWMGQDFERAQPDQQERLLALSDSLKGDGALTVSSDPRGADVTLWRLEVQDEKIQHRAFDRELGQTPIETFTLPQGRYILSLSLGDGAELTYPVRIDPNEEESVVVTIPSSIPDGMVVVPAGPFYVGGDQARDYRLHEQSLPSFFIRETEVTFAEYIAYWMDPAGADRSDAGMSRVQLREEDREFIDAWDAGGRLIEALGSDRPIVGITQAATVDYCRWLGERLGRTVRLPTAEEWEKAARGVDGRDYVWGNTYEVDFSYTLENEAARESHGLFAPARSLPMDRSVYGAFDLAGNAREWTSSRFGEDSPFYQVKGASASVTRGFLYCCNASDTPVVPTDIGFRYVMEYELKPRNTRK